MITIKCPNCGKETEINERLQSECECKPCGRLLSIEKDNPEAYKELEKKKDAFKNKLKGMLEAYLANQEKLDNVAIVTEINHEEVRTEEFLKDIWLKDIWFEFVVSAADAARKRSDKVLLRNINKYAREIDDRLLIRSIAGDNKGALVEFELREDLDETNGDVKKFSGESPLNKRIIDHIIEDKDIQFAVEIFYHIRSKGKDWKDIGERYLASLFDDKSGEILSLFKSKPFLNTSAGRKFIHDVKRYIKRRVGKTLTEIGFAGGNAEVWSYVEELEKKRRKKIILSISIVCAVIVLAAIGGLLYLNAVNTDTISIDIDRVIETTYGESLNLDGYTVTYKRNYGAEETKEITEKMLSGYDSEVVGTQQTVYVEFKGVKKTITIMVNRATLATPVLSQSGSFVSWEFVPNAVNYNVYINSSSTPVTQTINPSYDLSTNDNYGELSITVRANTSSDKYNNSAMSEVLHITKLQPPTNIVYEDGVLKWDSVSGADSYELSINGTPYTTNTNSYKIDFIQGDNEVSIVAKDSKNSNVVVGITNKVIPFFHLSPITSMSYQNDRISWTAADNINTYSIYVNGEFWKDFNRNYIVTDTDGFIEKYGEGIHEIGVICKSSILGAEPSDLVNYNVAIGNKITLEENMIKWTNIGTGATYFVNINGETTLSLSNSYLSIFDAEWKDGTNTVSVTAKYENQDVVCETVVITKLKKPTVSVSASGWITDGNPGNRFKVNDGEWSSELPDIKTLSVGEHTITVQNIGTGAGLEINSEIVEIKACKLAAPDIAIENEQVISVNAIDTQKYAIKIGYSDSENGSYTAIESLSEIRIPGEYFVKATLSKIEGATIDYDIVIDSDYSAAVTVVKLNAPNLSYTEGDERVTSDVAGVKFYYVDDGVECELKDGLISNLPKGNFSIYARKQPDAKNELTSENTPMDKRAIVFNMNITLTINPMSSSQSQIYIVFGGCEEIDELTFTYELKYKDSEGKYIGSKPASSEMTVKKNADVSNENIITLINYRLGIKFDSGYGQTDIASVEVIIRLSDGADGQILSYTLDI